MARQTSAECDGCGQALDLDHDAVLCVYAYPSYGLDDEQARLTRSFKMFDFCSPACTAQWMQAAAASGQRPGPRPVN